MNEKERKKPGRFYRFSRSLGDLESKFMREGSKTVSFRKSEKKRILGHLQKNDLTSLLKEINQDDDIDESSLEELRKVAFEEASLEEVENYVEKDQRLAEVCAIIPISPSIIGNYAKLVEEILNVINWVNIRILGVLTKENLSNIEKTSHSKIWIKRLEKSRKKFTNNASRFYDFKQDSIQYGFEPEIYQNVSFTIEKCDSYYGDFRDILNNGDYEKGDFAEIIELFKEAENTLQNNFKLILQTNKRWGGREKR